MKKFIFVFLMLFYFSLLSLAAPREFARGRYKDKKNKTWHNTISYEIKGTRSEVDRFIIGKKAVEIKEIKHNLWIIVIAK